MNQQNVILQENNPISVVLCLKQAFHCFEKINVLAFKKQKNKKPNTSTDSPIKSTEVNISVLTHEIAVKILFI